MQMIGWFKGQGKYREWLDGPTGANVKVPARYGDTVM